MKYIDSEKLLAEIERRRLSNRYIDTEGYENELLEIITSLQQEPRFPQYDNIVEKVFGAGNLEGWERDEAEMLVALAKEELLKSLQQEQPKVQNGKFVFPKYLYARTKDNKTIDMSYAPQDMTAVEYIRNDFVEQEQPDVDLEKEEFVGVAESPLKTFPRVNDFECGGSYRH